MVCFCCLLSFDLKILSAGKGGKQSSLTTYADLFIGSNTRNKKANKPKTLIEICFDCLPREDLQRVSYIASYYQDRMVFQFPHSDLKQVSFYSHPSTELTIDECLLLEDYDLV